jgi:hypothetical protein
MENVMSRWNVALGLALCIASSAAHAQAPGPRCGSNGTFDNLEIVALTSDQRLLCFRESGQQGRAQAREIGAIRGLMGGERLVGIDFRPANGMLYGLGNAGGVYIIDPQDGTAMRQSTVQTDMMQPVALMGSSFGVDFNPVPDRLRVVSDQGQSLRINVDTGVAIVDGALNPGGMGVTAVAYTNNDADMTTATVLYDIDTMADQLSIQAPPNAGTLNLVGALGTDVGAATGFDIFSQVVNGRTNAVRAVAVMQAGDATRVFAMNLTTGRAMPGGTFDDGVSIAGIAIPLVQGGNDGQGQGEGNRADREQPRRGDGDRDGDRDRPRRDRD